MLLCDLAGNRVLQNGVKQLRKVYSDRQELDTIEVLEESGKKVEDREREKLRRLEDGGEADQGEEDGIKVR